MTELAGSTFTWTTGTGPVVGQDEVPTSLLLTLALAYHTAQYRMSRNAERAARDLLLRLRPVSDSDMTRWMQAWDALLAAQQQQQMLLTQAYVRSTLGRFGVTDTAVTVRAGGSIARDLETFARTREFKNAPTSIKRAVAESLKRIDLGTAGSKDAMLADRVLNLANPVVKMRVGLSEGQTIDEVLNATADHVETMTDNLGRSAERLTMQHVNWPTFKDGRSMLYKRIITPGACGWCQIVATRLYPADTAKSTARWHRGCRCTWQLVSFSDATTYATKARGGHYYEAASDIGLWDGPAPASYTDYIRQNRYTDQGSKQ